jgi:hypothetical protein
MSIIEYRPKPRKIRKVSTLRMETEKAVQWLMTTLGLMIIVLAGIFLATTNQSSQKGYTLQQLEEKKQALQSENDALKAQITYSTAFSDLEDNNILDAMAEPAGKTFISAEDNKVR